MNDITMIRVENLMNHPQNPRKIIDPDEDMIGSIKASGILQPLTIIPGKDADPNADENKYAVLIGHRRLAGAIKAGLSEVPCVIMTGTTAEEQIKIMLLENMVRKGLSPKEQADSFRQLHLDFGMSVQEISDRSGLSTTTVRHRIKMAELDPKLMANGEARGVTLDEYIKLESIEDPALKNEALKDIGTKNFQSAVDKAVKKEKYEKVKAEWLSKLCGLQKVEKIDYSNMEYLSGISSYNFEKPFPELKENESYCWFEDDNYISIYAMRKNTKSAKEQKLERIKKEAQQVGEEAETLYESAAKLRKDYLKHLAVSTDANQAIAGLLFEVLVWDRTWFDTSEFAALAEIEAEEKSKPQLIKEAYQNNSTKTMIAMLETLVSHHYPKEYCVETKAFYPTWRDDENTKKLYEGLSATGYEISDMEQELLDGTAAIFDKAAALREKHKLEVA